MDRDSWIGVKNRLDKTSSRRVQFELGAREMDGWIEGEKGIDGWNEWRACVRGGERERKLDGGKLKVVSSYSVLARAGTLLT